MGVVMKKLIKFIPNSELIEKTKNTFTPARTELPQWYKDMPIYGNGAKKLECPVANTSHNHNLKRCVPFLDAMTSGYTLVLDEEVFVGQDENGPVFRWKSPDTLVTLHSSDQFVGFPIPVKYHQMVAKWHNEWSIQTPKGFSLFFSHPHNRIDLPFYTLSGFVDADKYAVPVQFPFLLDYGFEGVLPIGTPLAQMIPVKRESWAREKIPFDPIEKHKRWKSLSKTFADSYRTNFWEKKQYE
jgi:hypothetical protein